LRGFLAKKFLEKLKYLDVALNSLKPPEGMTVSQWADRFRILTSETSPEPGPYRTSRVPYCRAPMDSFSNAYIEHIVLQWASQTGKTDTFLNCLGYVIDQDPGPALIVMPTEDLGRFISRNRVQPMIEACERLRDKKPDNPDDYNRLEMRVGGMVLSVIGANSPASLSHRPVRYLFRDEVCKYPFFAAKEADPMSLSKERVKNFWNKKIFDVSSPTTEVGNITKELNSCDVVFDFHVPCPHCGAFQILKFEQIKWPKKTDLTQEISPDEAKKTAWYECEACSQRIEDVRKGEMLRNGEWRDRVEDITFDQYLLDHHPRKIGFHLPAWYSPWLKWGDCAAEFLSSKDYPEKLMNFRNSWAAEPWVEKYESKTAHELFQNRNETSPLVCPKGTIAITCGIDPGQGGFWVVVLAWRSDMSVHLIHYGFLTEWEAITSLVWENSYPIEDDSKRMMIWRAGVDTGGGKYERDYDTMTEACYDFLRQHGRGKIFGTKGASTTSGHRVRASLIDRMPGKQGALIPGGISLFLLDSDAFKDAIWHRLQVKEGDPGRFTFHNEVGSDFIRHLTAEEKRRDRRGQSSWIRLREANHWLDACTIAFAMADSECQGGVRVLGMARNAVGTNARRIISAGLRDWND
jgi:phage terminase large subunit GpA-like protein